ncbi:NAD(P)/FAD-dependent oxidoreductase [Bradyrhizobium sp. LHD-71]|uniref:FAD-dependent oxidoreductase n=1 Tax=Bradyrhizobium sp. LHD-71 TaxID=3072141 RepID=UPI00280EBDA6|nr:NAD(P)/FAD-dependent oxidoreductase [Bradyrhizobium sp. LHD-71]MDQ8729052.1 NAD(P)/FAD-dependent oxidoreductase [Bradyrhizobium sp. LHD-71]
MARRHAEIAGAGITGLTLAAALGQAGWSVRVHESAAELRSTGGGLYLRTDGQQAARRLGLSDQIADVAFTPDGFEVRIDGAHHALHPRNDATRTMLRNELHAILLRAAKRAGAEIVIASKAVALVDDGQLVLADGSRLEADLAIAADGVGSRLPETVGIAGQRQRYDDGLIRVLLNRAILAGSQWERTIDFWRYGDVALRVLYTPCSPTHCYLCLMSAIDDARASAVPIDVAYWSENFPELQPLLAIPGASARHDRYGKIWLPRWSKGRAVIIGDAAHGMPSSLGRGASVGMLNAVELVDRLSSGATIETALHGWELAQRPVVEEVQAEAERVALARALSAGNRIDLAERDGDVHALQATPSA